MVVRQGELERAWREKTEIARRIVAARILHGWSQTELNGFCAAARLRKDLAGALERNETQWEKRNEFEQAAFAGILGVPLDWFTAPVEHLLGAVGPPRLYDQRQITAGNTSKQRERP